MPVAIITSTSEKPPPILTYGTSVTFPTPFTVMVLVLPFRSRTMLVPVVAITGHGFVVLAMCAEPSGQNSIVAAVWNVVSVGDAGTGIEPGSRVIERVSGGNGCRRSRAAVGGAIAGGGIAGVPISSTIRYWPTAGQLKRTRIGWFAETAVSRAVARARPACRPRPA